MPRPYASAVIPAPVEQVWEVARDFGALSVWHPAIEASSLDSGTGAEVGAVRRLTLGDGGVGVERLLRPGGVRPGGPDENLQGPFGGGPHLAALTFPPPPPTRATVGPGGGGGR